MTSKSLETYVNAATRENTRRSYRSGIKQFEEEWGGLLPSTDNQVAQYLVDHAGKLTVNTLKSRLAALGQWHNSQGFPDPTKSQLVKKVLKGIAELHPQQVKQAPVLAIQELMALINQMELLQSEALTNEDRLSLLQLTRDKALILIGFWRAFRGDELCRLQIEHIQVRSREGMTLYLPRTKTNSSHQGVSFAVPALATLCPVSAYEDWIELIQRKDGPVFMSISRWGKLADQGLNPNSIPEILRNRLSLLGSSKHTGHSLRRGFASWANGNQWDLKMLMDYVGWKDVKSAMRYIEPSSSLLLQHQVRIIAE
tara:strand:+ start:1646 stop:2581 length:936 start_codon:yes stop_codon:yes gene_type:complete